MKKYLVILIFLILFSSNVNISFAAGQGGWCWCCCNGTETGYDTQDITQCASVCATHGCDGGHCPVECTTCNENDWSLPCNCETGYYMFGTTCTPEPAGCETGDPCSNCFEGSWTAPCSCGSTPGSTPVPTNTPGGTTPQPTNTLAPGVPRGKFGVAFFYDENRNGDWDADESALSVDHASVRDGIETVLNVPGVDMYTYQGYSVSSGVCLEDSGATTTDSNCGCVCSSLDDPCGVVQRPRKQYSDGVTSVWKCKGSDCGMGHVAEGYHWVRAHTARNCLGQDIYVWKAEGLGLSTGNLDVLHAPRIAAGGSNVTFSFNLPAGWETTRIKWNTSYYPSQNIGSTILTSDQGDTSINTNLEDNDGITTRFKIVGRIIHVGVVERLNYPEVLGVAPNNETVSGGDTVNFSSGYSDLDGGDDIAGFQVNIVDAGVSRPSDSFDSNEWLVQMYVDLSGATPVMHFYGRGEDYPGSTANMYENFYGAWYLPNSLTTQGARATLNANSTYFYLDGDVINAYWSVTFDEDFYLGTHDLMLWVWDAAHNQDETGYDLLIDDTWYYHDEGDLTVELRPNVPPENISLAPNSGDVCLDHGGPQVDFSSVFRDTNDLLDTGEDHDIHYARVRIGESGDPLGLLSYTDNTTSANTLSFDDYSHNISLVSNSVNAVPGGDLTIDYTLDFSGMSIGDAGTYNVYFYSEDWDGAQDPDNWELMGTLDIWNGTDVPVHGCVYDITEYYPNATCDNFSTTTGYQVDVVFESATETVRSTTSAGCYDVVLDYNENYTYYIDSSDVVNDLIALGQLELGRGCEEGESGNTTVTASGAETRTVNFGVTGILDSWFQVTGGDIISYTSIQDNVPVGCSNDSNCRAYISIDDAGNGFLDNGLVIAANNITSGDADGVGDPYNWNAEDNNLYQAAYRGYDYYADILADELEAGDIYEGNTSLSEVDINSSREVKLVHGDLTIDQDLVVANNDLVVIVVSGDVIVNGDVDNVQGVFIADGSLVINGGSGSNQASLEGIFILDADANGVGGMTNSRNRGVVNNVEPSLVFQYRPDFLVNLLQFDIGRDILESDLDWEEIAP